MARRCCLLLALLSLALTPDPFQCLPSVAKAVWGPKVTVPPDFMFLWDVKVLPPAFKDLFETGVGVQPPGGKPGARLGVGAYKGKLQETLVGQAAARRDKRLVIRGKKDEGYGVLSGDRPLYGTFDARVTVAVDDCTGLVDGETFAGFELQRPLGSEPVSFTSLLAVYTEGIDGDYLGFNVQAYEDPGTPLGPAVLFPGTAEVDLRIQQTGTDLITMARPTPPGGPQPTLGTGWTVISSQPKRVPEDPFTLGLGAVGLGKKGRVYFDHIALDVAAPGPDTETGMSAVLLDVLARLGDWRSDLAGDSPDPGAAETELEAVGADLDGVRTALSDAVAASTLHETTEAKTAAKVLRRASKGVDRLLRKLDKSGVEKPDKLDKAAAKVVDHLVAALANLSGFKARNTRKLAFVPPESVDDGGGGGGGGGDETCTNPLMSGGEFATATVGTTPFVAERRLARTIPGSGKFQVQFEDCTGEGSYLLLEVIFPGTPSTGTFTIGFLPNQVLGFASNSTEPGAPGVLFSGSITVDEFDPSGETIAGSFTANSLFGGDPIDDGAFRIEDFE